MEVVPAVHDPGVRRHQAPAVHALDVHQEIGTVAHRGHHVQTGISATVHCAVLQRVHGGEELGAIEHRDLVEVELGTEAKNRINIILIIL